MNSPAYQEELAKLRGRLREEYTEEEAIAYKKRSVGADWPWFEENYSREQLVESGYSELEYAKESEIDMETVCPNKITIPEAALGEMSNITLADGKIKVSPIAICVDVTDMPDYPNAYIVVTKIRFKDGTEYLIRDDNTANYMFAVGNTDLDVTFLFNRMIDVKEISSVILDGGLEYSVG